MEKKKPLTDWLIVLLTLVITYALLFFLSWVDVFGKIGAFWYFNYIAILAFFFFGYFVFTYLQEKMEFSFSEYYVGLILLFVLYLAYWLAFRVYYGNNATLSGYAFSDYYAKAGLNMFSSLINGPYIYIAVSFFAGWVAFFLKQKSVQ